MEWVAVSIGLGLIVSLLFTEAFGLSVGGMIVPGYLALHFAQPMTVVLTIAAAVATWGIVRAVSRHAIVFGRRRVVLTMLIGFAVGEGMRMALAWSISGSGPEATTSGSMAGVTVVGFVIPGLVALWIDRTSILQTLSPLFAASGLVHLTLIVLGMQSF
ncbi:Capsule biosynthesis protein CapC [Rubripirellula lacrimiformis]|uniref:Capsule biosynthesis protein CapC n=1 Tax=Rubripirellula lacrimiformis TaxID=1930273 RepID=A0A517N942_9BACT|nr:poly-gamma-glutamate biosynthesis protein PgsC [Rubripirellula lacrimiformis]QDT03656.1 Capsule biosynthesis protein CapC [Rubripirellula lacrimiformis]